MVKPVALRELAIHHYQDGKSTDEIYQALSKRTCKRNIYHWIKSFKQHKSILFKKSSGRPRSATNRLKSDFVKRNIKHTSQRNVAKKLSISTRSVRRILKENGKNYSYALLVFIFY